MYYILLLRRGKGNSRWDMVPLVKTASAAAACGVLGYKDRMTAHRGLPAVVGRTGWGQTLPHKVFGMASDDDKALGLYILAVGLPEMETPPEVRLIKSSKEVGKVGIIFM